jgi:putative aldouronate transport system substrate-binding protein
MKKHEVFKSACAYLLAAVMLVGCSGNNAATPTPAPVAEAPAAEAPAAETPADQSVAAEPSSSQEPITITAIYGKHDLTDDLATNPMFVSIQEKTGVTIDWEYISTDWAQTKAMLFASNELPDIFFGKGNAPISDADIMQNKSYFVPLQDLIDQYAPNIKNVFALDEDMKRQSIAPDGNIYSLPQRMPLRPSTFDCGFINKKWLDAVGMSLPETTEDLKNVLVAFKEQDPNGNGIPDEIPISMMGVNNLAGIYSLFGAFGITDSGKGNYLMVRDSEVLYWPTMPEYKEAIQYFNELNELGVLDPETFTQDWGTNAAKQKSDGVTATAGIGFAWTINAGVGDELADEYVQLMPLQGPGGYQYWRMFPDVTKGGRNYLEITTANKYPERTMAWANELYEPEMSLQLYFGALGVALNKTAEGNYEFLPPQDGLTEDSWQWKNALNDSGPFYVPESFESLVIRNDWVNKKLAYDEAYLPFTRDEYYPNIYRDEERSNEVTMLNTDIKRFTEEKMAEWIMMGGVDEQWESYLQQMEDMQLPRLMQIYQEDYDAYLAQ